MIRNVLETYGRSGKTFFTYYGKLTIMSVQSFLAIHKMPIYRLQIIDEFIVIGRRSFPIVSITAIFMGLVLGVQIGTQMSSMTAKYVEGGLVLRAILLEMGPVITAVVIAGRAGAGIASELGTMVVTEQVDALRTMAIDPIEILVMPRLIAGIFAIPALTVFSNIFSISAGFISTKFAINLDYDGFVKGMRMAFHGHDVFISLFKSLIFGIVIILLSCFWGLNSGKGARGVGLATTSAVVSSLIAIFVLDYIISALLL